jgi:glycosyltransferase involved in cell wall biosynthesis
MLKVSIITVVKNRKDTILRAIKSVYEQDHKNIEYIIVDGQSVDGTVDIISDAISNKTKFISQNDRNMYEAINTGLSNATGEIIGLLHSDDFFSNTSVISNIATIFCQKKIDLLYGDVEFFDRKNIFNTVRYYRSNLFHPNLLKFGLIPAHTSIFMRRELIDRVGLYKTNFKIAGDFEYLCRIFSNQNLKYYYLPATLVKMQSGGLSNYSLRSRFLTNYELNIAAKINNLGANRLTLSMRYFYKFYEYLFFLFNKK